jgi:hypothetical protein
MARRSWGLAWLVCAVALTLRGASQPTLGDRGRDAQEDFGPMQEHSLVRYLVGRDQVGLLRARTMSHSWASMLRTIRAAVAVMLLGGLGLTVPPQTRDMLAFLDDNRIWPAVSFQIALIVLATSAWFWSRAALAARFGINDQQ